MLYIYNPPAFVQTTLGSLDRGDLIYPVPAHVHSQIGNLHHTCKNCPMQAKVLVKSHWYLGTSLLTSSRCQIVEKVGLGSGFSPFEMRCHCGVCHWFVEVRGLWRIWIWIWNFPQVGKLDFSWSLGPKWKHVFSLKGKAKSYDPTRLLRVPNLLWVKVEHTPKTRKATSSFTT